MKTLLYFYTEHAVKNGQPFEKKSGWGVWHSCFDYLYQCGSKFVVLSGVRS